MLNQAQLTSIVRQIMLAGGGFVVGRGWITSETLEIFLGLAPVLGAAGWALYTRRANGLIASAAALPEVRKITADPTTADAVPSSKVVGATGF